MNLHINARLTLKCLVALVGAVIKKGLTLERAAARFRGSERTAAKWLGRFRREGMAGLQDRSSWSHRHRKTTAGAQVVVVLALHQMRLPGFHIAKCSKLSRTTVSRIFTRPYSPCFNGKAERFIQTSLRKWAYAAVYQNSAHRQQHLQPWLHSYTRHRPHTALNSKPWSNPTT